MQIQNGLVRTVPQQLQLYDKLKNAVRRKVERNVTKKNKIFSRNIRVLIILFLRYSSKLIDFRIYNLVELCRKNNNIVK